MSLMSSQIPCLETPLSPLTHPDEIRLLLLQPRAVGKAITCTIKHVKLSDKPQYEALSYVWGPKVMKSIDVTGHDHEVRENLFNALSHLRFETEPRVLWIDAICINQTNTDERNHQVSQMGLVFSQAETVVVWLGLPDDSNVAALKFFQSTPVDKLTLLERRKLLVKLSETEDGARILEGLHSLSTREYWKRLWIVQEFLTASKKIIQCGSYSVPERRLWAFTVELDMWTIDTQPKDRQLNLVLARVANSVVVGHGRRMSHLLRQPRFVFRETDRLGRDLFLLWRQNKAAECENQLDKVFGVWALANRCCQQAVPIDYSATMEQVMEKMRTHIETEYIKDT